MSDRESLPREYEFLLRGEHREPYVLLAILPEEVDLEARLVDAGLRCEATEDHYVVGEDGAHLFRVRRQLPTEEYRIPRRGYLSESESQTVSRAPEAVAFWAELGDEPLVDAAFERDPNALGGADDRDEYHSGPSGVLASSEHDVELRHGVHLDEHGWVECEATGAYVDEVRRTSVAAFRSSRSFPGRSMWIVGDGLDGTVVGFEDGVFAARDGETGEVRQIPIEVIEHWGVETGSGFCLGPWVAHELPLIEEVERRWSERPNRGEPVCGECGQPLTGSHTCGASDEST